jgi:hypothetical protein
MITTEIAMTMRQMSEIPMPASYFGLFAGR